EHVGTFTFEDCVFQDNGWLYGPGNSKGRFNQNHHVYLVNVGNVTFDRCSFNRASAQGIKARGFRNLVVRDSTFRDNLIDISTDDRNDCGTVEIIGTRFQNTGGIDSSGTEMGWSCNFEHYNHSVDRVTIRDCTWTGPGA